MSMVSLSEAHEQVRQLQSLQMLPALLEEHHGQWVVLRDQIAIKVLPTEMDAYHHATRGFPDERWSTTHP